MQAEIPAWKTRLAPWLPFIFCVFLCGIVMCTLLASSMEAAYPALVCFLPMTFFFLAGVLIQDRSEVKALEERVRQLEAAQNADPRQLP